MNSDKNSLEEYNSVNQILAEWNPIGVPNGLADDEYKRYVPNIFRYRNDYEGLVNEMKRILNDEIGLEYETYDEEFKNDTLLIAQRIIKLLHKDEA